MIIKTCWLILLSFVLLQVMEVSSIWFYIKKKSFFSHKSTPHTKPLSSLPRIRRSHPSAPRWIPDENRPWGLMFSAERCRGVSIETAPKSTDLTLCSSFPPQSCWRKKKSWWTPKCTSSPWGWLRPSLSRGSCPSWSSEEERSEEEEEVVFCCYIALLHRAGKSGNVLKRKIEVF